MKIRNNNWNIFCNCDPKWLPDDFDEPESDWLAMAERWDDQELMCQGCTGDYCTC